MFEFRLSREFRNKKIKNFFKEEIEPHETLLDSLAQKKEEELGVSEKKFEVPLSQTTLFSFLLFSIVLILFLFSRIFQLQIIEGKKFTELANENKFIFYSIEAERGVVYDRNFNQLIFNKPSFDLILDTRELPKEENQRNKILEEVSEIIKDYNPPTTLPQERAPDFNNLEKKIKESESPEILISENLDYQTLIILETKIKEFPGFRIEQNSIRDYKDGKYFSHLVGYTGKISAEEQKILPEIYSIFDYVGKDGLEKLYEEILRKNPGKLKVEKDAKGKIISKEISEYPQSGKSIVLWLDSEFQKKVYEELEKGLRNIGSKKGAAIALDPKTGGILALVSYPPFDNNIFSKEISQKEWLELEEDPLKPFLNRAISGEYPVGSTIKPLLASAALEEKIITSEKQINCQGLIQVPHKYLPEIIYEYRDWKAHGWTNIKKAIAESCNVYFYHIGGGYGEQEGLGPTRIKKYLELFGWGNLTQIDLPGEKKGLIPDPSWKKSYFEKPEDQIWRDGDSYNLSIGQGYIKTTPLQVATAFSALINNGKLLKPQVVQKIVDSQKNTIEEIEPKVLKEINIDQKNLQIVREGMREAVIYGSAVSLSDLPVKAAAKTGTAEFWKKGEKLYDTWITVFAPYEDPQIVLTLMMEDVKDLSTLTVLPVAKEVLNWYFSK